VKERPILFSGPMVRALLDGRKTQTRRVVKSRPWTTGDYFASGEYSTDLGYEASRGEFWAGFRHPSSHPDGSACYEKCSYGAPGDRLWVRETHEVNRIGFEEHGNGDTDYYAGVAYQADDGRAQFSISGATYRKLDASESHGWTPSIHMPRWASRITLEVTGVRVERLQDISRGDAMDEGCPFPNMATGDDPRQWFSGLWSQINGAESWATNPWVWVVEFKRIGA
jgi:hypothetical protein